VSWNEKAVDIKTLLGKTIVELKGLEVGSKIIHMTFSDGQKVRFYYEQDCCANCEVHDIAGDPQDLLNSPLTMSEEETNDKEPRPDENSESFTWTFYKFATLKGYVTVSWLGESNGYYNESVSLVEEK
jgi:hypothetical protein